MIWVVLAIIVIVVALSLFTVRQQTVAIVERFGKFKKNL
jgi:regulator of protease activity HflC (stomatin/prohibitin superfamily)